MVRVRAREPESSGWSLGIERRVGSHARRFLIPLLLFAITLAAAWLSLQQDRDALRHARTIAAERAVVADLVRSLLRPEHGAADLRDVPTSTLRTHVAQLA